MFIQRSAAGDIHQSPLYHTQRTFKTLCTHDVICLLLTPCLPCLILLLPRRHISFHPNKAHQATNVISEPAKQAYWLTQVGQKTTIYTTHNKDSVRRFTTETRKIEEEMREVCLGLLVLSILSLAWFRFFSVHFSREKNTKRKGEARIG
jgi:hypothetical protein